MDKLHPLYDTLSQDHKGHCQQLGSEVRCRVVVAQRKLCWVLVMDRVTARRLLAFLAQVVLWERGHHQSQLLYST